MTDYPATAVGAGDEGARSDFAGDGHEYHLVAGGRGPGDLGRTIRRWRQRYDEQDYDGLFDLSNRVLTRQPSLRIW